MSIRHYAAGITAAVCVLLSPMAAADIKFPVSFAADVKVHTPGVAEPQDYAKYYVGEHAVRYEYTKMPERQLHAAILDFDAGKQWTLIPDQQTYFTFSLEGTDDADLVHFQPAEGSPCPEHAESENKGTEQVLGRETEQWTCEDADGLTTYWVDTRLAFPIRTENPDGSVIELHDIEEEDQPPEYFQVPQEFTEAQSQ